MENKQTINGDPSTFWVTTALKLAILDAIHNGIPAEQIPAYAMSDECQAAAINYMKLFAEATPLKSPLDVLMIPPLRSFCGPF